MFAQPVLCWLIHVSKLLLYFLTVAYHWLLIMLPSYSECSLRCWCMHLCLVTLDAYLVSLDSGSLCMCLPLWPGHCNNLLSRNPNDSTWLASWPSVHCLLIPAPLWLNCLSFHHFTGCQRRKQSKPINLEMLPLTNQKLSLLSQLP